MSNRTRRDWLRSTAAALPAAALLTSRASAQEYQQQGADLKLGIASYSLRKFSRPDAIRMAKQLHTPFINIKDFHLALDSTPEQIDAARTEFTAAGLTIVGIGTVTFNKTDDADIRHKFEYAKRLGAPVIVCAPTAETLPRLEPFVKEFNIKIAIHNHGPEDKHFPTPQSALKLVESMDPRCGLCIDVGHTARTGVDIVEAITQAGPRLHDLHLKDLADLRAKESQVICGKGKIPFPQIFRQLLRMQYRGAANLEYEIDETDPMPGMQQSLSYLRGVLAGITSQAA